MFKIIGKGPYCAISYDSPTFNDLHFYMEQLGCKLLRQDPQEFLSGDINHDIQYINLVSKFPQRQEISEFLDKNSLCRFSFFGCYIPQLKNISDGVFVYPGVDIYPSAKIQSDVVIHSGCLLAHGSIISQGSFLSGHIAIAGGTTIGKYCWIGLNAMCIDNISIANHTTINSRSLVIKSIVEEHTTYNKHI